MNNLKTISVLLVAASLLWGCNEDDNNSAPTTGDMIGTAGSGGMKPVDMKPEPTKPDPVATEPVDIIDTAIAAGSFSQLAKALTAANLVDTLKGEGPFTVFAPTDDAFDAFEAANPGVLAGLSTEELTNILLYHVVAGDVRAADLVNGGLAATVQGAPVQFDLGGATPMVLDAGIVSADVVATNGVIHVIDAIILPPSMDIVETALDAGSFTKLADALTAAGLVETLQGDGPFTVFAPTDAAFEAFEAANPGVLAGLSVEDLTGILTYHVVGALAGSGNLSEGMKIATVNGAEVTISLEGGVSVDDANVSTADILTSNGVIHVIDSIILP